MPAYSKEIEKWYHRAHWRNLRTLVLARDPVCMMCQRNAATIADHIIPHKGAWSLFTDLKNLQGVCKPCHDRKTAREDGGFGHVPKSNAGPAIQMIGDGGRIFLSTTVGAAALNKALGTQQELDELLKSLPE